MNGDHFEARQCQNGSIVSYIERRGNRFLLNRLEDLDCLYISETANM